MKEKKEQKQKQIEAKNEADENVLIVHRPTIINDGVHSGEIANIVRETRQEFDYIDVYVDIEDSEGQPVTIKTGFPAYISKNSSFGRFLTELGLDYAVGEEINLSDVKEYLVGKTISFQTYTEDQFARIINKTIRKS
jgi:hypothetical protein